MNMHLTPRFTASTNFYTEKIKFLKWLNSLDCCTTTSLCDLAVVVDKANSTTLTTLQLFSGSLVESPDDCAPNCVPLLDERQRHECKGESSGGFP